MKIPGSDGIFKNTVSKADSKGAKKSSSKGTNAQGTEKGSGEKTSAEKVLLSSKGRDISKINEIIKSSPDIRTEKVERIKNEIAKGTYSVDGKKIAEKILKEILSEADFLK